MKQKVLAIGDLSQYVEPGVPVGFVGYWMGTVNNIPDGWFICNGSTFNATLYPKLYNALNNDNAVPDMTSSARFIRCSTTAGSKQGDAMRNIVGDFSGVGQHYHKRTDIKQTMSGPFFIKNTKNNPSEGVKILNSETADRDDWFGFDLTKTNLPIANEIRPINISAIPIIKHD